MTESEHEALTTADPTKTQVVRPFLDGDDLTTQPTQQPQRYVLCFGESPLDEARRWPDLIARLTVRVQRLGNARAHVRERWWQFEHYRAPLYRALSSRERALVCASISKHFAFAWCPVTWIFSHNLTVFVVDRDAHFALLQSRVNQVFATTLSSTVEDRAGFRPSDCFETLPFPSGFERLERLDEIGRGYHQFRAELMAGCNQGLRATYDRFDDPDERSGGILRLRELHDAMDRIVLDAYGWADLPSRSEFLPDRDYEADSNDDLGTQEGKQRRRYRYRWPDKTQEKVLARLLALNQQRAQEEALSGATAVREAASPSGRKYPRKRRAGPMFDA